MKFALCSLEFFAKKIEFVLDPVNLHGGGLVCFDTLYVSESEPSLLAVIPPDL
ncbi:hypothetical protein SDC9_147984 [bioreactor metagenome]|uniref:Uncharacterized protein n=1 Tax=bioreactor metagenome TaxID=1076179 RepID=A0A645EH64_9ZZZZ